MSLATKTKVIQQMLRSVGFAPTLPQTKRHVVRVDRGLSDLDSHAPGWHQGLLGGEFDFRDSHLPARRRKDTLNVLNRLGKLPKGVSYTDDQRKYYGFALLDPKDRMEAAALYYAVNVGLAERIAGAFGPFDFTSNAPAPLAA